MNKNFMKWAIPVIVLVFAACNKNDFPKPPAVKPAQGVYVLNEGGWGNNNASLGYYDFATTSYADLFESKNNTKLGDVANDAIIYGNKAYIVVNKSGTIVIADAANGKLIKQLDIKQGDVKTNPRCAAAHGGVVYITTWDGGIEVIDTATLQIVKNIPTRAKAEGVTIVGNEMYVTIGGEWNGNKYDSVVSVFNLPAGSFSKNITVGINPGTIKNDGKNIYVIARGNYGNAKPKIVKYNLQSGQVTKSADGLYSNLLVHDNRLYSTFIDYATNSGGIKVYDPQTLAVIQENFITDGTSVKWPYGVFADDNTGDIYITDASDFKTSGSVFAFDKTGKKKFSFLATGGIGPNKILFKR